jgi:hypothetical protein
MVQERLAHRARRLSRVRALAASGAVLASLVAGGTFLAAPSVHAAVKSAATATCGWTQAYIPAGDNVMLITQPGFEVFVWVLPITPTPGPFGYVMASGLFTGQTTWQPLARSSVGTLVPLQVSSFSIKLVFNPLVPGQYSYDVLYNSCQWAYPSFAKDANL